MWIGNEKVLCYSEKFFYIQSALKPCFLETMYIFKTTSFAFPLWLYALNDSFWNKSLLNSVAEFQQQINTTFWDLKQKTNTQNPIRMKTNNQGKLINISMSKTQA